MLSVELILRGKVKSRIFQLETCLRSKHYRGVITWKKRYFSLGRRALRVQNSLNDKACDVVRLFNIKNEIMTLHSLVVEIFLEAG